MGGGSSRRWGHRCGENGHHFQKMGYEKEEGEREIDEEEIVWFSFFPFNGKDRMESQDEGIGKRKDRILPH